MKVLHPYFPAWQEKYEQEAALLSNNLVGVLDIQHIGSTSIPGMLSKPIIDIAVPIGSSSDAEKYLEPLQKLGYCYFPESSSTNVTSFVKPIRWNFTCRWHTKIAEHFGIARLHSEIISEPTLKQ